jgi:lipopolysaccharide transport system permease protein
MLKLFRLLRQQKDLLYMLSRRDITVKYKQSVMGFLWAILMPLLITFAGVLVKAGLARVSQRELRLQEILGVTVKALPWSFFVASIRFSTTCLSNNADLVTKIAFPRAVFPLSAVMSQLFDFSIATVVLVLVFLFAPVGLSWHIAWVPLLVVLIVLQAAGLALLLSAANLFFRDVKYLVEVVLTFAIFFTPVFYDVEMFGRWGELLLLNPIAPLLVGLSDCIVAHRTPPLGWVAYSAGITAFLVLMAPSVFLRLEPKFAETI